MKAAVLWKTGSPLRIDSNILIPTELKRGQVLVQIAYSGVCHSQLMEVRGKRGLDRYLPHLLGHEGSGIVAKVGPGVSKVGLGDKVILGWIKGDGLESGGCQYDRNSIGSATEFVSDSAAKLASDSVNDLESSKINSGAVSTFSEYSIVSENRCFKVPDGIPMDIAVLFGCAILTGSGIITNKIQPQQGSSIAVFGLGGVGLSALMAIKLYSCKQVIAVDVSEEKLRLAQLLGATDIINSRRQDPVFTILEKTQGHGVDYSVEAAGLAQTIEQAFQSVRKGGGLCVFASHPKAEDRISLDPFDLISGKQIQGTWGGGSTPEIDIPRFAELYKQGKLPLESLISRHYSLDEINLALNDLENQSVIRPLIAINPHLQ